MADNNDFDVEKYYEQMRRNQEMDKWRMMQDQTESLRKMSGRQEEGMSTKETLIFLAWSIPVGLFLVWLYFQFA